MAKKPLRRLSIWRLKQNLVFDDAIGETAVALRSTDIQIDGASGARLITKQSPSRIPDWVGFLRQGVQGLAPLQTQSAAALLLINVNQRIFALTFGAARFWLNKEAVDRRFGMMVTLNAVEENSLRSLDREEFEAMQRKTRTQTSSQSDMGQFGIDVQRDLLKSVTGKPADRNLAEQMTGGDSLVASMRVEFVDLPDKLRALNDLAESVAYRQKGYEWVDHFHRVTDPAIIARLQNELVQDIRAENLDSIFLSAPTSVDFQEHIGFLYPKEREKSAEKHPDLRIEDYVSRVGAQNIDIGRLKSDQIRHYRDRDDLVSDKFSIYNAIIYEKREPGFLYVLTDGDLYQIDNAHVLNVENELNQIPLCRIALPSALNGEVEKDYNERVCAGNPNHFWLLDRKSISYGGQYSKIEVCDILTANGQFIHVKPKIKSSTLSHLFNQGLVSAQCLRDSRFRDKAAEKCDPPFKGFFQRQPNPADHEIVFAIISTAPGDIRQALPFFSKQSLINAAATIKGLGHPVCITKVDVV